MVAGDDKPLFTSTVTRLYPGVHTYPLGFLVSEQPSCTAVLPVQSLNLVTATGGSSATRISNCLRKQKGSVARTMSRSDHTQTDGRESAEADTGVDRRAQRP